MEIGRVRNQTDRVVQIRERRGRVAAFETRAAASGKRFAVVRREPERLVELGDRRVRIDFILGPAGLEVLLQEHLRVGDRRRLRDEIRDSRALLRDVRRWRDRRDLDRHQKAAAELFHRRFPVFVHEINRVQHRERFARASGQITADVVAAELGRDDRDNNALGVERVLDLTGQPIAWLDAAIESARRQDQQEVGPRGDLMLEDRIEPSAADALDVHEDVDAMRTQVLKYGPRDHRARFAAIADERVVSHWGSRHARSTSAGASRSHPAHFLPVIDAASAS